MQVKQAFPLSVSLYPVIYIIVGTRIVWIYRIGRTRFAKRSYGSIYFFLFFWLCFQVRDTKDRKSLFL